MILFAVLGFVLTASSAVGAGETTRGSAHAGITGTVKDALGRPLANVAVRLQATTGAALARTRTDAHGRFSFRDIAPAIYAVVAEKSGFEASIGVANIATVGEAMLSLTMESKRPLTLALASKRLTEARNALSPETGSSVYRFNQQSIERLPQGNNVVD